MRGSDNDNIHERHLGLWTLIPVVVVFLFVVGASGQNVERNAEGSIPALTELLGRPVALKRSLDKVHPRLFFSAADLTRFREKARGSGRELWQETLRDVVSLKRAVPDPDDPELYKSGLEQKKGSISQYSFAFEIAQASFAYAIEQDERYLVAAKKWTLAACDMPIWGYTYNKPNVDLPPAHLLYAVAFSYDLLYDKYTPAEREIIRNKLVKQGRLMYEYFKYKAGKRYTYSQNHTWIPMAGLAIAAYAIMDEVEEAKDWAKLSRAVFDRTIQTFGTDGFFYESFHYYGFAFRWAIRYFDVHKQVTGEDLYIPMRPKLTGMKYFVMHSILPDGENVFDFADVGDGPLNRNGTSKRESLYGEYDILYRLAAVYHDAEAQTVGDFVANETKLKTREPMWAFINRDADLKPAPLSSIPLQYRFEDNDTAFWRTDWTKDATAFAFRCAPPEGHHAAKLARHISDWRQNTGHAHPDANTFIIWANGKYLTGDTGYLGLKQTDDHNTVLVDGRGQEKDGVYEMFKEVPNERLDKIRLAEVDMSSAHFYARGHAASAYYSDLGLNKFDRHFLFLKPGFFVIWDELETQEPSNFTFLMNGDRAISLAGSFADIVNGESSLRVFRLLPTDSAVEVVPQVVQARGLPGSVDKGDAETRGVQLRIAGKERSRTFDFVNVLVPFRSAAIDSLPSVTAVSKGRGVSIVYKNGDRTTLCLGGGCDGDEGNAGRVTARIEAKGMQPRTMSWQRPESRLSKTN